MEGHFLLCNCLILLASFGIGDIVCPKIVDMVKESISKCSDCLNTSTSRKFELDQLDLRDGRLYSPARIVMSDDYGQISFMGVDAYSGSSDLKLIMEVNAAEIIDRKNRDSEGVFFENKTSGIVHMSAKFKRKEDAERFCLMYRDEDVKSDTSTGYSARLWHY